MIIISSKPATQGIECIYLVSVQYINPTVHQYYTWCNIIDY